MSSNEKRGGDLGAETVRLGRVEPTGESCEEIAPEPCAMVIFGASGDLARRKLIPAVLRLTRTGLLTEKFFVIGASRTAYTDDEFRERMREALSRSSGFDERSWSGFAKRLFYVRLDYSDSSTYAPLMRLLEEKQGEFGTGPNRVIYLATPPSVYTDLIGHAGASGLADAPGGWTRLVVEKPYGHDTASARELDRTVYRSFSEDQVYRIDHYLGKDTVQNIMMFRFANLIFEPIWNRRYIDHVQITASETIGVEKRAGYYEQAGVIRDMFQNHMLQVLSIAAMEPPGVYESELVRDERVKVLRALRPLDTDNLEESLVVGQYAPGETPDGHVPGYTEEPGVAPDSRTATFAAMKLHIDNWRWQGVPFYLRSGKRLASRFSQVTIQFKDVPHRMFSGTLSDGIGPNALIMRIQPDERLQLKFHTKNPGSKVCLRNVVMDFPYTEGYRGEMLSAYERVLIDCMLGDKMLFVRSDGMELSWSFLTPVLRRLEEGGPGALPLNLYRAGSRGPVEAARFIERDRRRWVDYE